ncbi:DUF4304 domain-containing protein [Wenyingzhuangia sp. IMCC45574]
MKLFDLKKIFNKSKFNEMDDLSKEEGRVVFKKIISEIHKELKQYGFKKQSPNTSYRIVNNVYQSFYFQKSQYGNSFTINTCIRPISWHRPESYYLLSSRRVGDHESNRDKWYKINSNYIENCITIAETIKEKVIPVFEKLNSTLQITENEDFIKNNKIYDLSVELSSVIEENLTERSLKLLNVKIQELNEIKSIEWAKKDLAYFEKIRNLILSKEWKSVNEILEKNKLDFFEINKKVKTTANK